jgi:hypothetical protein
MNPEKRRSPVQTERLYRIDQKAGTGQEGRLYELSAVDRHGMKNFGSIHGEDINIWKIIQELINFLTFVYLLPMIRLSKYNKSYVNNQPVIHLPGKITGRDIGECSSGYRPRTSI